MYPHKRKEICNMDNPFQQRKPGLKCPKCGTFIETSMEQIILGHPLICKNCRLKLLIDTEKSRRAIEALKEVKEVKDKVEKTGHFSR